MRRQLLETAQEKAFDEVAEAVLGRPRDPDSIMRRAAFHDGRGRAMSRPILEPTDWGQQQLQGTLFGRFAQAFWSMSSEPIAVFLPFAIIFMK